MQAIAPNFRSKAYQDLRREFQFTQSPSRGMTFLSIHCLLAASRIPGLVSEENRDELSFLWDVLDQAVGEYLVMTAESSPKGQFTQNSIAYVNMNVEGIRFSPSTSAEAFGNIVSWDTLFSDDVMAEGIGRTILTFRCLYEYHKEIVKDHTPYFSAFRLKINDGTFSHLKELGNI